MVSVTSASRYITSVSRYQPRYQSRSFMYICGRIPENFAELAKAVLIGSKVADSSYLEQHESQATYSVRLLF